MTEKSDLQEIKQLLEGQQSKQQDPVTVPQNLFSVLVLGILAAVGTFVWSNATITPVQTAESFGLLQQQTAEIRTTVLEMRSMVSGMNDRLEHNTKQQSEQQAKITGLETRLNAVEQSLQRVDDDHRARH